MDQDIFKSDNTQIMPVLTVFGGLMDFYRNYLFVMWGQVKNETDPAVKLEMIKKIYAGAKDNDLEGVKFVWRDYKIEGNDQLCVRGTILDVTNSDSRIYPYYKRFTAGFKYLIYFYSNLDVEDIRSSWGDQCANYEFSEQGAIQMIDDVIIDVTKEGGAFEEIINLAANGQWRII